MTPTRGRFFLGVFVGASTMSVLVGVALLSGGRSADARGLPGQQPPAKYATRTVFENDRVRVKDVVFPPGVSDTGMHTHVLPHVGVILTPGVLAFTEPGKPDESVSFEAGAVGYREANVTHQVANPGKTPMRVIEVELK